MTGFLTSLAFAPDEESWWREKKKRLVQKPMNHLRGGGGGPKTDTPVLRRFPILLIVLLPLGFDIPFALLASEFRCALALELIAINRQLVLDIDLHSVQLAHGRE